MQKVSLTSEIVTNNSLISTDQVSYQTKFRTLLMDISVEIIKGSKTALIGATGSGKTTFLRLLNRLADPSVGTITLTGKNIQEIPIQTLRRRVLLVPQEPSLLGMTVAEAIAYPLKLQNFTQTESQASGPLQILCLESRFKTSTCNPTTIPPSLTCSPTPPTRPGVNL